MQEKNPGDVRDGIHNHTQHTQTLLLIRRCEGCGKLFAPTVVTCASCRSADLAWVPSTGTGTIMCSRELRHAPNALAEPAVSTIAIVALDTGPWLYTTIDGDLPLTPRRPVRVHFRAQPRGERFPVFTPSPEQVAS